MYAYTDMPSAVTCGDCGAQFEVTQKLWDDQIDGKLVRVRCKRCGAKIELDGRDPDAAPKHSKPPPPNAREKLTSIIDSESDSIREETPTVPLTKPGQLPSPGKLPSLEGETKPPAAAKSPAARAAAGAKATEKASGSAGHAKATEAAGPNDPWLVSYADDDDRELSTDAVKAAFRKGEIHTETLIWRDGMDEWLVITEVPVFAELFKPAPATDQTGGFLGTGVGLGVGSGGPTINTDNAGTEEDDDEAPPISLVPDSLPPESIDPDSVEPKLVALGAGTMAEPKPKGPPPRREHATGTTPRPAGVKLPTPKIAKATAPEEAPRVKRLPKPPAAPMTRTGFIPSQPSNPKPEVAAQGADAKPSATPSAVAEKPQGKAKPRPPANLKRPETVAFEAEGAPPDSIPDVAALSRKAGTLATPQKQDSTPDDLPLTGGVDLGGISLGVTDDAPLPPTIKVDDLEVDVDVAGGAEPSEAEDKPSKASAKEADESAGPVSVPVSSKSGKKKKKRSTQSGPPSSRKIRTETHSDAPVTHSKPPTASSKPAVAASEPASEESSGSKAPLYIGLGLAAAFAVYWFGIRDAAPPEEPKPQPVATQTATTASPTPATATPEPEATAEPVAEPESEKPAEPAPEATAANHAEIAKPLGTGAAPEPTTTAKPTATAEAPKPTADKPEPTAKPTAAPPPDEPTPVATAPFDVAAARSALASAAGAASACRKPGDPSGIAQVTITFAPSGRATSANIGGPPFAGTATGGCIAGTMRGARVPPFTGSHKTVSKTVVIN